VRGKNSINKTRLHGLCKNFWLILFLCCSCCHFVNASSVSCYYSPEAKHSFGRIMEILYGAKTVFTHSAITSPKMNRFRWNLEHCEHIVGLCMADFGCDPHSSDRLRGSRNFVVFYCQLIGEVVKTFGTEFWKFYHMVSFFQKKNRKICSQNFQVLRLQAVVTTQWSQIARNSLPNWPSAGCPVSFFSVRINSKSFPWALCSAQERFLPKFSATSDVRYCVL